MEEEEALSKLVVAALSYYGLELFHVEDGRELKPCMQFREGNREEGLEEFIDAANLVGSSVVEHFVQKFCRPSFLLSTAAARATGLPVHMIPESVLRLVGPELAEQGNMNSSSLLPGIWATFSTFIKDDSGHFVPTCQHPLPFEISAHGIGVNQTEKKIKVEDMKFLTKDLAGNKHPTPVYNLELSTFRYSPTRDYSRLRDSMDTSRPPSAVKKQEKTPSKESDIQVKKRTKLQPVMETSQEHCTSSNHVYGNQGKHWQEDLARDWPDIFQEIQGQGSEGNQGQDYSHLSKDMNKPDNNHDQGAAHSKRKRKRTCGTDETIGEGGTLFDESSPEVSESNKEDLNHRTGLFTDDDSTICVGEGERITYSEVGSSKTVAYDDIEDCVPNPQTVTWPTPLYGDYRSRAKACLPVEDAHENEELCSHEFNVDAQDTCLLCKKKEDVAYSKYTLLFKDDLAWKQKFLKGENLTCDICISKGKYTHFADVSLLMSHGQEEMELRVPDHRGYARAIDNLMLVLNGSTVMRTCCSVSSKFVPQEKKQLWPPVIVLENTFKTSDQCHDINDLEEKVSRRLKGLANIEKHALHRVKFRGVFKGMMLVEFPPSRRGLIDAERLHQHFLLSGRSWQDWMEVKKKLKLPAGGADHLGDLVRVDEKGCIRSRIIFGYLATEKLMTKIDTFRHMVKWRVMEVQSFDDEEIEM